jgi:hypothetical protein
MSDTLTFAELEEQHVELLPARIVLTLVSSGPGTNVGSNGSNGANAVGTVAFNFLKGWNTVFKG